MRKLKRMVARKRIEKDGISQCCKHRTGSSFFSKHWREYLES